MDSRKIHCIAENDDKLEKMIIKQRLQRSNNQQSSASRTGSSPGNSPVTADHTLTTSSQTNTCKFGAFSYNYFYRDYSMIIIYS